MKDIRILKASYLVAAVLLLHGYGLGAQEPSRSLDAAAVRAQASMKIAGLSVAVQIGDELIFAKGYGEADLENHVPSTPNTVYRIASVTKQFTAAAVLKLADSGDLELQDYVREHVPIFDQGRSRITLHQLLTHTSGLLNYSRFIGDRNRLPLRPAEVVAIFEEEDLEFPPGKNWKYSNSGYFLLGLVIQNASGMSYGDYIERELSEPLGLADTVYCDNARLIENRAAGYVPREGSFLNAKQIEMNAPFAAGALCSTVLDLSKWAQSLFTDKLLPLDRVRQMTAPVKAGGRSHEYGYGIGIDELNGHLRFHHAGSISGFSSYLAYFPDSKLSIAVLSNTGRVDASSIGDELAGTVFDLGLEGTLGASSE